MRVLIVEDGRYEAQRYSRELEKHGFESRIAGDVATAKRLAHELVFDVALVDMGLPLDLESHDLEKTQENPNNGVALLDWLDQEIGIPVFALTGTADPSKERAIEFPLIRKPVYDFEEEVISRLERCLGRKQEVGSVPNATLAKMRKNDADES